MAKWEEVADGSFWQLADLRQYEPLFEEGAKGLLELDLRLPVSQDLAQELEDKLRDAGVEDVKVRTASPMLQIFFRKGFPWLAIIAAIILGLIILAILIIGFRLFREIPEALRIPLLVAGVGILALLAIVWARRIPK